jgi:hypothetical protein
MTVLASTKRGEIGVTDREIQAFQPFFLEHDPPKMLTIGDVIDHLDFGICRALSGQRRPESVHAAGIAGIPRRLLCDPARESPMAAQSRRGVIRVTPMIGAASLLCFPIPGD